MLWSFDHDHDFDHEYFYHQLLSKIVSVENVDCRMVSFHNDANRILYDYAIMVDFKHTKSQATM